MKALASICLALFVTNANALVTPEKAQLDGLQKLLDNANQAQIAYQNALEAFKNGELDQTAVNAVRDRRAKIWKRVIDGVLIAYGMALPFPGHPEYARLPKMTFAYGDYVGQNRDWVITFSDLPLGSHIAEQTDPKVFKHFEEHRKNSYAITAIDGTTTIFKTDYKTPAQLAFTLFHERSHYDQLADPAFKNSTSSEREVVSWKLGLANIHAFGFTEDELADMRPWAGRMIVKEELKSISARGQRNLRLFGKWIRDAVPIGDGDTRQEMETSIEGVMVDAEIVGALRKDAERIAEEVEREADERQLLDVARETCESTVRLRYDDAFQARYRRVPEVTGEPRVLTSDACAQEVFARLWRAKAQGLRNAAWHAIADAAESLGGSPGGGSGYVDRCIPSPEIPCPESGRSGAAVAETPASAVPAQLPRSVPAAQAWTTDYALNLLASKGCADPWAHSQADLDRHWARLLGMTLDGGAAARLGLQGCQDRLFRSLMEMASRRLPDRLTQEVFARTAEAARNPAPVSTGDDMPDIPGEQAPTVPTCRHHPWCRTWGK